MTTLTLIGERLAEPGRTFVYEGEASGCVDCPYRSQCLNLSVGTTYEITNIREGAQRLPCAVHEDDVIAVEVEETSVTVAVPDQHAMAGNRASLAGPCPFIECPSHEYCIPAGATLDQSYRIETVHGDPPHETCQLDRDLTLVEVADPRS